MNKLIIPPKIERLFEKNPFLFTRGHDFVEIGGIKWATCNVGAKCPTDPGFYFQWGDTMGYTAKQVGIGEGKKHFGWKDYKYCENGLLKYNFNDNKTVLSIEDDAAHVNWGGAWRMPTIEELAILCSSKTLWTDDYHGSGVAGVICTDKTDSSKELFLPAIGCCRNGHTDFIGYAGCYLSKTLNMSFPSYCHDVTFSDMTKTLIQNEHERCRGQAIRGVLDI